MAVSRTITKKSPSQDPVSYFECKQSGGTTGASYVAPDKLRSGAMREKMYGRKDLGKK